MHISVVNLEEEILNNLERRYLIYNTYAILDCSYSYIFTCEYSMLNAQLKLTAWIFNY